MSLDARAIEAMQRLGLMDAVPETTPDLAEMSHTDIVELWMTLVTLDSFQDAGAENRAAMRRAIEFFMVRITNVVEVDLRNFNLSPELRRMAIHATFRLASVARLVSFKTPSANFYLEVAKLLTYASVLTKRVAVHHTVFHGGDLGNLGIASDVRLFLRGKENACPASLNHLVNGLHREPNESWRRARERDAHFNQYDIDVQEIAELQRASGYIDDSYLDAVEDALISTRNMMLHRDTMRQLEGRMSATTYSQFSMGPHHRPQFAHHQFDAGVFRIEPPHIAHRMRWFVSIHPVSEPRDGHGRLLGDEYVEAINDFVFESPQPFGPVWQFNSPALRRTWRTTVAARFAAPPPLYQGIQETRDITNRQRALVLDNILINILQLRSAAELAEDWIRSAASAPDVARAIADEFARRDEITMDLPAALHQRWKVAFIAVACVFATRATRFIVNADDNVPELDEDRDHFTGIARNLFITRIPQTVTFILATKRHSQIRIINGAAVVETEVDCILFLASERFPFPYHRRPEEHQEEIRQSPYVRAIVDAEAIITRKYAGVRTREDEVALVVAAELPEIQRDNGDRHMIFDNHGQGIVNYFGNFINPPIEEDAAVQFFTHPWVYDRHRIDERMDAISQDMLGFIIAEDLANGRSFRRANARPRTVPELFEIVRDTILDDVDREADAGNDLVRSTLFQ